MLRSIAPNSRLLLSHQGDIAGRLRGAVRSRRGRPSQVLGGLSLGHGPVATAGGGGEGVCRGRSAGGIGMDLHVVGVQLLRLRREEIRGRCSSPRVPVGVCLGLWRSSLVASWHGLPPRDVGHHVYMICLCDGNKVFCWLRNTQCNGNNCLRRMDGEARWLVVLVQPKVAREG